MMFENFDLDYYYSLAAPIDGGSVEMTMLTGHSDTDKIKAYYLNKEIERGPIEFFTIYPDGLVTFFRNSGDLVEMYSNKPFDMDDDHVFHLVG